MTAVTYHARDRVRVHQAALAAVQPRSSLLAGLGPRRPASGSFVPWLSAADWREPPRPRGYNPVDGAASAASTSPSSPSACSACW